MGTEFFEEKRSKTFGMHFKNIKIKVEENAWLNLGHLVSGN